MNAFLFFLSIVVGVVAFVRAYEVNGWPWWRSMLAAVAVCWLTIGVGTLIAGAL